VTFNIQSKTNGDDGKFKKRKANKHDYPSLISTRAKVWTVED